MDFKLEVIVLPVSDVDRALAFYQRLGWRLDADFTTDPKFRVVQLTPPGSPTSVIFGTGLTDAVPGSSQGLHLVVGDIQAAHDELAGPFRGRIDLRLTQDFPDRRRGDLDPEGEQFAVHPAGPPRWILRNQAQHQRADRADRAGPSPPAGTRCCRVAAGMQVTVPAQDRVGPHQQAQAGSGQRVQQRGQPCPIGRLEPDPLFAELTVQHGELVA
ncbi:VOC family protein [Actinoplanes sp. GCM10030250]|uniref:VOC family protein n=1 Tax=Actinoplanes sp. GCM10030250 TaxID=3273376 RepID=UPI00361762E7